MNNPANTLGLDYRAEAASLPYTGPIVDVHTHVASPGAADLFLEVAELYGVVKTFTMTGITQARELAPRVGDKIEFMCVPDYMQRDKPGTFTTQWLDDIKAFREQLGCRVLKLWAAPRSLDLAEEAPDLTPADMKLDSPLRRKGLDLAYDLGYRLFMTHVADPDTWFATKYTDASRYGTKAQQYEPLERLLDEYADATWIGAHMGGTPEDLDFLQGLLDRHPNYVVDTSACKWIIRELSKHPQRFAKFVTDNPGRVLFGTDIVAAEQMNLCDFDLFASRYWSLRTIFETAYAGSSPIVDPDLHMVDPSLPENSTAELHGAALDPALLPALYYGAAEAVFSKVGGLTPAPASPSPN